MKRLILLSLLLSNFAYGSGWHDYTLDIGDGYYVFRANARDIGIGHRDKLSSILGPTKVIGPLQEYQMHEDYILARTAGIKSRNRFEGDTSRTGDYSKEYIFIIQKSDGSLLGPFDKNEFTSRLIELGIKQNDWIHPKNPNFWTPLLGTLMFLAFSIPILAIKYYYVSVPLLMVFFWVSFKLWTRWKQNKSVVVPDEFGT